MKALKISPVASRNSRSSTPKPAGKSGFRRARLSFTQATLPFARQGRGGTQAMPQAPELWLSDNEPEDIERFFRFGNFRLRRFENNLVVDLSADDSEAKEEIDRYLKKDGDLVFAYLQWRLEQIQQRKTTRQQPHQVILLMRRYRINDPGEGEQLWEGPHTTPVARWQPGIAENPNFLPLEMYNPVTKQFESVPK